MKKIFLLVIITFTINSVFCQPSPYNKCNARCKEDLNDNLLTINIAYGITGTIPIVNFLLCEGLSLGYATPACIFKLIAGEALATANYGWQVYSKYQIFKKCQQRCKDDFHSTGDAGNGTEAGPGSNTETGPWNGQGWNPGGIVFGAGSGSNIGPWGSSGGGSCKPVDKVMSDDDGWWDNCLNYHGWQV